MALDFQDLYTQVKQMGESAPLREHNLQRLRLEAQELFENNADQVEALNQKITRAAAAVPTLRCARPEDETLTAHFPLPEMPQNAHVIAADGSQITPDRHTAVEYYLINVGAIHLQINSANAPKIFVKGNLFYGDALNTHFGVISDSRVSLDRDLREREYLSQIVETEIARDDPTPIITLTDGPLELWGAKDRSAGSGKSFDENLAEYKRALRKLQRLNASTAGYVDKPRANLVVKLLEIIGLDENKLAEAGRLQKFRGITDFDLFHKMLKPGERSAIFGLQSQSINDYTGALRLYFFYLNVGDQHHPWLARVEIPAWVAQNRVMLNQLHAIIMQQCKIFGRFSFPYVLHRSHEAAVVSLDEKEQLSKMITQELLQRGLPLPLPSYKQSLKNLPGRARR